MSNANVAGGPGSSAERFAALGGARRVELLRRLVEAGRLEAIPDVVPPRDPAQPVRLSPAQEDLWVYESLYPDTAALNLCCSYHFDTPVDPADLEAALTVVVGHHDSLRMRITGEVGDLRVGFAPVEPVKLERLDLRGTGVSRRAALHAFSRRAFDLDGGPLLRGAFVTVDDTRSTLVLALHHIATDWWSFDVLHGELTEAYRAVRERAEPRLSRPAIQYADFAGWQRELAAAGVFEAQLGWWRGYLANPPKPLTVGTAVPSGPFGVEQVAFRIDARTEAAVRELARQRGATVYGVLMTAFAVFAHRLTGEPDLITGTPVANRSAKGLDRVIGYVMNSLPVRWRIGGATTFAELLARFTAEFPQVLAHADVPVGRIVQAVDPERVAGRSPLFQWVFMHLPRQESVARLREIADPERVHTGGEHDLIGIVRDSDNGFEASLEIRTDLYAPEVVRAWADAFTTLLGALVAEPDVPVSAAPMVSAADGLDGTLSAVPAMTTLPDLVARQAGRTPDAVAVESAGERLTYRELVARVDGLAGVLAGRGVGPESVVALGLGRSVAMVVALLAVQRAGGAYLPLDPDHPRERLAYLVRDAGARLLIAEEGVLPELGLERISPGATSPTSTRFPAVDHRDAAYVIYTSGSTGHPKGVVVSHEGIACLAHSLVTRFGLGPGDRVPQLGAPTFDISVAELCMAFGSGGTLVLPPGGTVVGAGLGLLLRERRVTFALVPPSVLATVPPGDYPDLRGLASGADVCPPELVTAWAGRRFWNAYGPTETTVAASVSDPLTPGDGPPPIGRPLTGTRLYVLDARLRPVPVGVPGELYAGGLSVARGYLGRPGLTAERFVADPYGPAGARMYRTGDLAHRRPDGQIHFLGRADDQLKVRGLRIEPAEIESALVTHPDVAQAAVALRDDRLIAYLVPATGEPGAVRESGTTGEPEVTDEPGTTGGPRAAGEVGTAGEPGVGVDVAGVLARAVAVLPAHMVPSDFVVLAALPLTPQGKLDRAALPAPDATPRPGRVPTTDREAALCALIAELLGLPETGADDDFFRLGGDSVTAIQLVSRARARGLELTPREVFTARTPAALAALARTATVTVADDPTGRFPITPIMHWWREHGGPLDTFVQSLVVPVPDGVDERRIRSALRTLTIRHAALRMRLLRHSPTDWELEVPPPEEAAEVPFEHGTAAPQLDPQPGTGAPRLDPERGQMLWATWDAPDRLVVTAHHFAVDGVSWRILGPELAALLTAPDDLDTPADAMPGNRVLANSPGEHALAAFPTEPTSTASASDPAPVHGISFARWARLLADEAVRPERVAAELPLWERMVADGEPLLASGWRSGPPTTPTSRATLTRTLAPELTHRALVRLPAAFRCGPNEVLLSALAIAATRWRGGTGLLADVEGHGREPIPGTPTDVTGTVGWFTTQYPVGLDATGSPIGVLKRVKERLRSIPSSGLGHGLLRYLNPDTSDRLAGLPAADVRFNYLGRFEGELAGAPSAPMAYALELDTIAQTKPDGTRLVASWSYAAEAIGAHDVQALAGLWEDALAELAGHDGEGGATSSDFPLVDLTQSQIDAFEADLDGDW